MINFYREFISKDELCFDIGANNGSRTDIFAVLGAKVISVEPQSACVEILKRKFANNARVTIAEYAVGSGIGEAELRLCEETDQCATLSEDFAATYAEISGFHWLKKEKIKVTTLDQLCRQFGVPDFCKIDVEGSESEVFSGLNFQIKNISFEFNRPLISDTFKSLSILKNLGEYKCNFIAYENMKMKLPEWVPIKVFCDQLYDIIPPEIETGEIIVRSK